MPEPSPQPSWQRIQEVLEAALAADPAQQDSALAAACQGDHQLLAAAQDALARFSDSDDLLGLPVFSPSSEDPAELPSGARLGAYQVDRELGRGGMGIVYLAHRADDAFFKTVAIKVLRFHGQENDNRFRSEGRVLGNLEHPHIVRLHDAGQTPSGALFLVMEFVDGQPLDQFCRARHLPLPALLKLIARIASAVAFAHERGILHADLKPSNILISSEGHPRLLDFGLSTLAGSSSPGFTPQFASPEQRSGQPVDFRSDVYSLGCILAQLTTGQKLPAEVASILARAQQTDPQRRYPSAQGFATDLHNYLSLRPVSAHSTALAHYTALSYRASLFLRRHPWPMGSAAVLAAILLIGLATYLYTRPETLPAVANVDRFSSLDRREAFPAFSPDSKRIAFAGLKSGNWDIYVQNSPDQAPTNLTASNTSDDTTPAWSPDGKLIAFHSGRDGGGLFLMDASGGNLRKLCPLGFHPAWSPNGRQIAYSSVELARLRGARGLRRSQIWLYDLSTGQNRKLIPDASLHDGIQPVWSPNGKHIAFWGTTSSGATQIYSLNPQSNAEPTILVKSGSFRSPEGRVWNPVWSPSGRHLSWFNDKGGAVSLLRASIDSASATLTSQPARIPLPITDASFFTFSPDGRQIAYTLEADHFNIEKLPFDPASRSVVGPPVSLTSGPNSFVRPRVSPDGQQIVFESQAKGDLWLARADGAAPQLLVSGDKANFARFIGNSHIGYVGQTDDQYFVATIGADGQNKTMVIPPAATIINSIRWLSLGFYLRFESNTNRITLNKVGHSPIEINKPVPPDHAFSFSTSAQDPLRILGRLIPLKRRTEAHAALYDLKSRRLIDLGVVADDAIEIFDSERYLLYKDFTHVFRILDRQTGKSREVYRASPDDIVGVDFSQDQRWLYYGRSRAAADIWIATMSASL
jgi:serine/threonine protein kinase